MILVRMLVVEVGKMIFMIVFYWEMFRVKEVLCKEFGMSLSIFLVDCSIVGIMRIMRVNEEVYVDWVLLKVVMIMVKMKRVVMIEGILVSMLMVKLMILVILVLWVYLIRKIVVIRVIGIEIIDVIRLILRVLMIVWMVFCLVKLKEGFIEWVYYDVWSSDLMLCWMVVKSS